MITKEYGIGLRKQAAALREQADLLEKRAAAGAVIKPVLSIAGKLAAKIGAPTSKLAGKLATKRAVDAVVKGRVVPATNKILTAIRDNPKAAGAVETVAGTLALGAGGAAALKGKPGAAQPTAGDVSNAVQEAAAHADKTAVANTDPGDVILADTGGNDNTDYSYPEKKDDGISPNLITGGATAAGGIIGGILGNKLAPEKYKKLMTAIGAITGAAISGAGAHYGQKYYNA